MLLCLGVTVLLGHAKVNNVYDVGALGAGSTDQKIVRLDVSVNEVLLVNSLNARQLTMLTNGSIW
jgi:hypothetical protein